MKSGILQEVGGLAVDGRGDVIVTGSSIRSGNGVWNSDYLTVKYASQDGAMLWQKRYNPPSNGNDFASRIPRPLALGPNGTIAVTGSSRPPSSEYYGASDFVTILYREVPAISITRLADGFRLRCFGQPGAVLQIWRSEDVTVKGLLLYQETTPPEGSFEFTDTSAPSGFAFYHIEMVQ